MRETGLYWVMHRKTGWTVAWWDSGQSWWALAFYYHGDPDTPERVCSDTRWCEIGPRLEPPR